MIKKPTVKQNPTLPKVSVIVGGTEYSLCFSFNALATAESLTGLNLLRSLDFQNISAVTFRALLFASLLDGQPELTLQDAGSLITAKNAPELMSAVVKAWVDSNAEPEEDSKNGEPLGSN